MAEIRAFGQREHQQVAGIVDAGMGEMARGQSNFSSFWNCTGKALVKEMNCEG
jgi:hypothetical protein